MVLAACCTFSIQAQRMTDRLGRGLVAVPTGSSGNSTTNMVTWRRLAEEYFGVTYNLYKNGSLLASGLTVPCRQQQRLEQHAISGGGRGERRGAGEMRRRDAMETIRL